jgi:spore germination cell wall hydrolase CwlJ-like protein
MFESALLCLATAVYFEARGEPWMGQVGVAQTAIARTFDPEFPDTICDVVQQGRVSASGFPLRDRCHFSFYCDGKKEVVEDRGAYGMALLYSALAFVLPLDTARATHYHSTAIQPWWAEGMELVSVVGDHAWYMKTIENN